MCEAKGIPHPIISWQHNGLPNSNILENNRRRIVEVRNRSMAGKIECTANNGVGQPAVAGIDMIVLCKFSVFHKTKILRQREHISMNFSSFCT